MHLYKEGSSIKFPLDVKSIPGYDKLEIENLKRKFYKHCNGKKMNLTEFRSMLGIFGLEDASFVCDRLFAIIPTSGDDEVILFISRLNFMSF